MKGDLMKRRTFKKQTSRVRNQFLKFEKRVGDNCQRWSWEARLGLGATKRSADRKHVFSPFHNPPADILPKDEMEYYWDTKTEKWWERNKTNGASAPVDFESLQSSQLRSI